MKSFKSVYEYDNYRDYLKDFYQQSKASDKKFSFRYFTRIAGFKSPTVLKHVMDGKRNLSENGIEKFSKALKLNRDESQFFRKLVLLNQATTADEKEKFTKEILRSKTYRELNPLKESQLNYLMKWYLPPIREMVALPGFREEPEWIAKKMRPPISVSEARDALDELMKLGLLLRDPQGRLVQAEKSVLATGPVMSAASAQYHKHLIGKAAESIDLIPRERREIAAVTFKIPPQLIEKIKEMIQNFRGDVMGLAAKESDPTRIYQLNLQFFPLAEIDDGEKK